MAPRNYDKLIDLFVNVQDRKILDMLLHLFFTDSEREVLVDRYDLVKAFLTSDLTQREIAEKLGLSISKITAGSKATKNLSTSHKNFLIKKMHGQTNNSKLAATKTSR